MGCSSSTESQPPPANRHQHRNHSNGSKNQTRLLGRTSSVASTLSTDIKKYEFRAPKKAEGFTRAMTICDDHKQNIHQFYTVDTKVLAEGAYGSVKKATHKKTNAKRAVKMIRKKVTRNLSENELFVREIAIMKQTDHPHIINLHDIFDDKCYFYLVMEMCTGGELFERVIDAEGGFTEKQAAYLSHQMLSAVFYLHRQFVCHRDLKPENFLFESKGPLETSVLKLIDFGLATPFQCGELFTQKYGSSYYIAPEVIKGEYGYECDNWSMGIIVFVLIAGHPPFMGDTDKEIMASVSTGHLVFEPDEWKGVSDDAHEIVRKLLHLCPKSRFTCEDALAHKWVRDMAPQATGGALSSRQAQNLRNFHMQDRFKRAALQVMAGQLAEDQIASLRDTFEQLDTDGDGLLSEGELKAAVGSVGLDLSIDDIVATVNADGTGKIAYTEFVASVLDSQIYMQESLCKQAFCVFDRDGSGSISLDELKAALIYGNDDSAGIASLFEKADTNGDGEIDFEEFCALMRTNMKMT